MKSDDKANSADRCASGLCSAHVTHHSGDCEVRRLLAVGMSPCEPIRFADVVAADGEVVNTLAPDREPCRSYPCGGCDQCLLAQAIHYGLKVYPADKCTRGRQ